ncbi:MAG: DUF1566 domain-containing protein [Sulfurovum sp.]|nr:DUF1566 domain-containing protein [Sulfurovum sp.]
MKKLLILCLLIGVANAKFIRDNTKEVVLDTKTNLIWQDDSNTSNQTQTWANAIAYCEASTLGGYDDWHLPSFNELYYLANREKFDLALNSGFSHVSTSFYWSSTTYVYRSSNALGVYFSNGYDYNSGKSNSNCVRCVRDGQ